MSFNYHIPRETISEIGSFFSKKFSIEIDIEESIKYECIAIEDKETQDSSILKTKFIERYKEYNINNLSNTILFFDIESTYSDKFIDSYLIPALVQMNKNNKSFGVNKFPNFIIYLHDLDDQSITFHKLIANQFANSFLENCYVFDKNANFIYNSDEIKVDKQLSDVIESISSPILERFQARLVRKINHFKRILKETGQWIACQQFFYEAVNADKEIYELIKNEFIKLRENKNVNINYIIYDCPDSPWLEYAIKSVFRLISSEGFSELFSELSKKETIGYENIINLSDNIDTRVIDEHWKDVNFSEIIFVTDLIHTGTTFVEKIGVIKKKFPESNIYCISALVTENAIDKFKNVSNSGSTKGTYIAINSHKVNYEIKYFSSVEQVYMPRTSATVSCHMCRHSLLPAVETIKSVPKELTSYEFWMMCEESGYKLEDNKPRADRNNIDRVIPDTLRLFKKNMPLLAVKFERYINDIGIDMEIEKIVVFADNTNNFFKNDENKDSFDRTPNGYFVKSLNFFNPNYSFIGIPRDLIQYCEKSGFNDSDMMEEYKDVFKTLIEIDKDKPIIVIDENNFTGNTFKAIFDILQYCAKTPKCYFPIFNYDSLNTDKKYSNDNYENVAFLSLYKINNKNG